MNPRNRRASMPQHNNTQTSQDERDYELGAQRSASVKKKNRRQFKRRYRTDSEWVSSLIGQDGTEAQQSAHADLSNYLYVVLYNYLSNRSSLPAISSYCDEELITLAQDFVQIYMEKMVSNDYALIGKYRTAGRFTSWAAQVAINLSATELRRAHWSRQVPMTQQPYWDQRAILPESAAVRGQVSEALESCLAQLPNHYREVLVRCIGDGERASDVAADLDVSPNAVYILIHRAKNAMRKHLTQAGIGPNSLDI